MLSTLKWESLESRRKKSRLNLLYKINWGLVEVPKDMLTRSDRRTRGEHKFRQLSTNKDVYKYSFFPRTITDWNNLPESIGMASSLESFKSGLSTLTFEESPVTYRQ